MKTLTRQQTRKFHKKKLTKKTFDNQYSKLKITDELIKKATERFNKFLGNQYSKLDFEKRLAGFIGEEIFQNEYPKAKRVNSYNYDFILANKKIEIKSTMINSPHDNLNIFIPDYYKQECDYYYTIAINKTYKKAWKIGYLDYKTAGKKMTVIKKGDNIGSVKAKTDSFLIKFKEFIR